MNNNDSDILSFLTRPFRGLQKEIWLLSLVMLINRAGMMVVPFMSLYFLRDLDYTKFQASVVVFSFGFGGLLGSYLGGWLSDLVGCYKVMLWALLGAAFGFYIMGTIENYYLMCIWVFLVALVGDAVRPAIFSSIAEYSDETNLTRGISLIRMAINLGIAIGPAIGGYLAHNYGYKWIFYIDSSTCFVAAIFLILTLRHMDKAKVLKTKEEIKNSSSPYKDGAFLTFMFFNLICLIGFMQIINTTPVFFEEIYNITTAQIGWFFTANGLIICFTEMPIIYWLEKRKYQFSPLIVGAVMIAMSYLIFNFVSDPLLAIAIHLILISFGEIINFPFITSICISRSDDSNRGKYMGAVTVAFSLSFVIAPLVGLAVAEQLGYELYWYAITAAILLGAFGVYFTKPLFSNEPVDDPEILTVL